VSPLSNAVFSGKFVVKRYSGISDFVPRIHLLEVAVVAAVTPASRRNRFGPGARRIHLAADTGGNAPHSH